MSGDTTNSKDSADEAPRGLFRRRVALQSAQESLQPEAAPPPPARPPSKRNPTLSAVSGFVSFLLILAVGVVGFGVYAQHQLREPGPLENDKVVLIAQRTEVPDIIAQLEKEGVVDSGMLLNAALLMSGDRKRLKAGEYLFKAHASLHDVIDTLVSGHEILHSLTIAEGLTSEQIVAKLNESDLLTGDVREIPKEGSLLPETYRIARGMAKNDLIRKMQDDQKKALEQIWSQRSADLPLRSSFDLLTLASIVEKETGKADERPRVAGVFINRLRNHIKLQSDPTIVYGIVFGKGTLGRGILRSELDKPTPYNTYVIDGLPPGPISNPGRAAMEAVANPSRTKEIYFVADGSGGHAFAETLDQHNKNVTRWRQLEKDKAAAAGAATAAGGVDQAPPPQLPAAPAAPARGQRGDLESTAVPLFGALSPAFDRPAAPALAYSPPPAPVATAIAAVGGPERSPATAAPAKAPAAAPPYAINGKIDSSFAQQLGLDDEQPQLAEAPVEPGVMNPGTYPESPSRRADQLARAARFGAASARGGPAPDVANPDDSSAQQPAGTQTPPSGPRVVRIYDASEGTAIDPLKDKTWDLNSPKTVPVLAMDVPAPAKSPAKPAAKPKKAGTPAAKAAPAAQ